VRAAIISLILLVPAGPVLAQGTLAGRVRSDDGRGVAAATVTVRGGGDGSVRETVTDSGGAFRLGGLAAGSYEVVARKVGYRSATQRGVRLADGQILRLDVLLSDAPRQLSAISVVGSATSVDVSTPALPTQLDRSVMALLPGARTATSLIALVPGARKDQLWGGAPGVSNHYQLDGVGTSHPGLGGDFLQLSVDWIETLEVHGLGAGAEHGNFQGGLINARTRTGGNTARYTLRANHESPSLTASNFNLDEDGVEQAGRRELAAEALGPIARDRLYYFVAGQYVARQLRSPDLTTPGSDFQPFRESQSDARALGKLTWLPALGHRVDVLGGFSSHTIGHAGINGVDDVSATQRVRRPVSYLSLSWEDASRSSGRLAARIGGFTSVERRDGYRGDGVPGIHVLRAGRQPSFQNAAFAERRSPSNLTAGITWETQRHLLVPHDITLGGELSRGRWRDERTRNGGLTWRPFGDAPGFDPHNAATWGTVGSEWGGDIRLSADVGSEALFVEDEITLGPRATLSVGLRAGSWSGFIRPYCAPREPCYRFQAVRSAGLDPRLGLVWDVTGRGHLALKTHFGRYHQGMHALFFDRVTGASVYENQRFYDSGPALASTDTVFTPAQRDAPNSGFPPFFGETILDVSGRVDGYRQPYVDQAMLALEKGFGDRWKAEAIYVHRRNGDIVGLVDRNLASNYTPIRNVHVDHRFQRGLVIGPDGQRLVLPVLYASNRDILDAVARYRGNATVLFGYPVSYLRTLTWNPDVVLTAVPDARRVYDQLTFTMRTVQERWRAEGSLTGARLRGNVPGVAGFGTTATRFTAGPFVNPNEGINGYGYLPDALQMEGKVWAVARLPRGLEGGLVYTHTLGERFTPSFEVLPRFVYADSTGSPFLRDLFRSAYGQHVLLEPRGDRHYASRAVVDVHLSWRSMRRAVVTLDLFNALGENELVSVETVIREQDVSDPSSFFGAGRLRVPPRTLRVGLRVE
jgi:hypothetical protein